MRVLVTRPAADGERTADVLRARGHEPLLAPLLRIEPIPDAAIGPGPWRAIAFTSANAVEALLARPERDALLQLPAVTVGERSAAAARAAGFKVVHAAQGDVVALARLLAAQFAGRGFSILYLAAERRAADLAGLLAPAGLAVDTVPVYRAVTARTLPATIRASLGTGRIDVVLHYSRRTAQAYVDAVTADHILAEGLAPRHLCLSAEVAIPLIAAEAERVAIASHPNQQALLALLEPWSDCCDHP